jgi:hypothetical protein
MPEISERMIENALPNNQILTRGHCRDCGAYNVHTSENGLITWETPLDNCCVQRVKTQMERFERHANIIKQAEIEKERDFERKKADRIEELERFKRNKDKIEEEQARHFVSNQVNLDYYLELMNFVDDLKRQIDCGEIPDARDIRQTVAV